MGRLYTGRMSPVADDLRREQLTRQLALTPDERIALALSLGREAIRELSRIRGISVEEATREFQRQRQVGRQRSACHDAVIG